MPSDPCGGGSTSVEVTNVSGGYPISLTGSVGSAPLYFTVPAGTYSGGLVYVNALADVAFGALGLGNISGEYGTVPAPYSYNGTQYSFAMNGSLLALLNAAAGAGQQSFPIWSETYDGSESTEISSMWFCLTPSAEAMSGLVPVLRTNGDQLGTSNVLAQGVLSA